MRRQACILFLLIGLNTLVFGQAFIDSTTQLQADIPEITLNELEYNFELKKDSLTLTDFDFGTITFEWKSIDAKGDQFYFRYRPIGGQWSSKSFEKNNYAIELEHIPQNTIFEYQLGSATSEGTAVYEKKTAYFNSFCYTLFENNVANPKVESVDINWALRHNKLNEILKIYPSSTFEIKYNTKIGAKQNKANPEVSLWKGIHNIPIDHVTQNIDELTGGEKYVYKIGINTGDRIIWSKKQSFEAERPWGIFKFLVLIGSLGLFIFGMKIMSEGLQKASGSRLRNMLASITSNRVSGVATGIGITSVVQSSSVTTVMTVSFVNAGLMTLKQAAGVIMGANIGTTMTAWLILLFGFKVDIAGYALILIAIGAPLLFFTKNAIRNWGAVIIGFSLLFMGLGYLKSNVPDIGVDSPLIQFFIEYRDAGLLGTLMFVGLGTLATVIIQSSSATMALTMTMVAGGVLPFEVAAAMILGENIGTTITAQLAALIGNVHAKRAARIHAFFNLIGVVWCILVFHFFLQAIAYFIPGDPFTDPEAANTGLAIFHTVFNVINVLLLIWFVPKLVQLSEWAVKSRGRSDEEFHLDYIGTGMMGTPDLSILEAKKEVAKFGEITGRMSKFVQQLLVGPNNKEKQRLMEKIAKYEEITDRVELEVATYLAKVSSGDMSEDTAQKIRAMNEIVNDLERLGDIFFQMSKVIQKKDEDRIYFLPEQRQSLLEMFMLVDQAFEVMVQNLEAEWEELSVKEALMAEEAINEKRDRMRQEYLQNMGGSGFNVASGMVYNNLFTACEKAGDHIMSVTEAITGNVD